MFLYIHSECFYLQNHESHGFEDIAKDFPIFRGLSSNQFVYES